MTPTMSNLLRHLHFLLLIVLSCVSPSSSFILNTPVDDFVGCAPRQIQALTKLKNEFDTRGCNHSDSFNGVWCSNSTGEIEKLKLTACLSGTLMPNSSLFKLHHLRYLNLSKNNFTSSSLPSQFGNLNKLKVLSLSSNRFLGQVPSSYSNLTLLSILDLSHNQFSGALDPNSSVFKLHNLRGLSLASNYFNSSIPSELGNLNKLEFLSLSSNGFFGQVPPTVSNLTQLTELFLYQNKLTGSFPLVQNLTELSVIDLEENNLSGTIPSSLLFKPFLSYLRLGKNNFEGSIEVPNSSTSSRLQATYLQNNHFDGKILEPISKLINLKELDLSYLNISFPNNINLFSSLKYLSVLDLSGNSLFPVNLRSSSNITLNLESYPCQVVASASFQTS